MSKIVMGVMGPGRPRPPDFTHRPAVVELQIKELK